MEVDTAPKQLVESKADAQRGFVFVLDALLALTIAALLYAAVSAAHGSFGKEALQLNSLREAAQDLLNTADKLNVFNGLASMNDAEANSTLCSFLNAAVPSRMLSRIQIKVYRYAPDGDGIDEAEDFALERTLGCAAFGSPQANLSSTARRQFTYVADSFERFGLATAEVWYK